MIKSNTPQFFTFRRQSSLFLFWGIIFLSHWGYSQTLTVDGTRTIEINEYVEVDYVTYGNINSHLIVNGTLIVRHDLQISKNQSSFTMGPDAKVIVYGNLTAENQVNITLAGYLFIYGNFDKGGSSGQDIVIINQGKIYILGTAANWGTEFSNCGGNYEGTTTGIDDNCDFGNEEDFENNQDQFPDEVIDLINCYDLSSISATPTCPGGSAILSINNPLLTNVTFEWQEKLFDTWTKIGSSSSSITVTNITDFEKQYRVIVRPITPDTTTCKISISRSVKIQPNNLSTWTGTTDTNWNNTANWSCGSLPTLSTNVVIPAGTPFPPVLQTGNNGQVRDLTLQSGAVLSVVNRRLSIAGNFNINGTFNAASGTVAFVGTSPQSILHGSFSNGEVQNLIINNASGVTSAANINIINSLLVEAGNLETGGKLKLISTASGTAFIHGTGSGTISGNITMQRYLSNGFGYKYFSSPFDNTNVAHFSPFMDLVHSTSGFPHFYEYIEGRKDSVENDLSGWQNYSTSTNSLQPGKGYALNISGQKTPVTIEISGTINPGPVDLVLNNKKGTYTKGFHLVGNPFPSPINWNLVSRTGLNDAIHFFTAGNENRYTGTYTSYVNGVTTGGSASGIIPSMQGFFVQVSDAATTATLRFDHTARTGNQVSQPFYKASFSGVKSQLKISAGYKGNKQLDAAVLYFSSDSSPEFEKELDAPKLLNTAPEVPSLYMTTSKGEKLSINAIPEVNREKLIEIPLGIVAEKSGEMILALADVQEFFPTVQVYLKDLQKNSIVNLLEEPLYSFTAQKGEINNRFILLLSSEKLSAEDLKSTSESFKVYTEDGEIVVRLNLSGQSGKITLTNLAGQTLQTKSGTGNEDVRFKGFPVPGIYMVTLEHKNLNQTKKILIKN